MKHRGFNVVWVTHPSNPVDSPNARRRKKHLAFSTKAGTKSLCNMLVDDTYEEWMSDNGYCKQCLDQAEKRRPKKKPRAYIPPEKFKKNHHLAKKWDLGKVGKAIENYPAQYRTPKYLLFIKHWIEAGWDVRVYEVRVSKYVFIEKGDYIFKIRFSNHKPIESREQQSDCDYYVGISNHQTSTTEEIIKKITEQTAEGNHAESKN